MEIFSFVPLGYEGELVKIEVDVRRGIPGMEIVGLPTGAVREARERIRIALGHRGFRFPSERILINLSPADVIKSGSGFDLPMALAILAATGQWTAPHKRLVALGELSLTGEVLPVPFILPAISCGISRSISIFFVPYACAAEAHCFLGISVFGLTNLSQICNENLLTIQNCSYDDPLSWTKSQEYLPLRGLAKVEQALEIAAAGGHSLLLYGPPGSGKTLAARCLEDLLLPLDDEKALEVTRLWSLSGKASQKGLIRTPPFRKPHHDCSLAGMIGGGKALVPGEISLAHHGVLFLDEAPEYSRRILQALREPLEDGAVNLARAGRSYLYPSRFQLVMTANSCPCGQLGKKRGLCLCGPTEIRRYWDHIGNALMDRVELRLFLSNNDSLNLSHGEPLDKLHSRLETARRMQKNRNQSPLIPNSALTPYQLTQWAPLQKSLENHLHHVCQQEDWSTRAIFALHRVALTLADLSGHSTISWENLIQAIQFRRSEGEEYWQN